MTQGSGTPLKVFVSSTLGDALDARALVSQAMAALPLVNAWRFEQAPAADDPLARHYLLIVDTCDLYVLLLGQNVSGPLIKEFRRARERRKPCLVFAHQTTRSPQVEEFLKRLESGWKEFATADDLRQQLAVAVALEILRDYPRWQTRVYRREALNLITFLRQQRHANIPELPAVGRVTISHEWITIPAGWFTLGSDRKASEKPLHRVELPAYRISKYPVTNEQFMRFVRESAYETDAEHEGHEHTWQHPQGKHSHIRAKLAHPVVYVSWYDALAYTRAVGARLPTEAEWEKAARGADGREYPWGNEFDGLRGHMGSDTAPVWKYPGGASPFGVMDMAGNVWEWCSSLYRPYPYRAADGREDLTAEGQRVLRGGSWYSSQQGVRCAERYGLSAYLSDSSVGFRVVELSAE